MEHEEHVLNLSDVVHDEPMGDDEPQPSDSHNNDSRPSAYESTANILSPLDDTYTVSESSQIEAAESYSVEMLEREIASLLNQNASAASAALLSAAAQQRQANLGLDRDGDVGLEGASGGIGGLGLSGLAAVLQAVHAQVRPSDDQHDSIQTQEQKSTRTAPAFHSLTAAETSEQHSGLKRRTDRMSGSEGSDYLFPERDAADEREFTNPEDDLQPSSSLSPRLRDEDVSPPSGELPSAAGEFSDLHDILNQYSAQFEPESTTGHEHVIQTTDSPPVISHAQPPETEPISATVPKSGTAIRRPPSPHEQPVASTSQSTLTDSVKRRKTGPREKGPSVHICEEEHCQKSFTRRSDLARHRRIHTGERPWQCNHPGCGKTFIQRSALHVHSRVHTGEKPHCCEYPGCAKTFGDSSSLARHRRTHTGKRPYKCEEPSCEKTFTRRTTLTTHMRTHDPNWEPDPNVKYNFKGKKRKLNEEDEEDDDRELVESVRSLTALFQPNASSNNQPLAVQMASISVELAAAIAQVQSSKSQEYEDEEDEESGSAQENGHAETIGPNTSGIRGVNGDDNGEKGKLSSMQEAEEEEEEEEEDEDSDAFPVPLRERKARETATVGSKRKR
ncbi:hypothetical protein D9613_003058 [Agrocybe pediades]|uniref:C2H2-type domain-containing protein n=1 Tax=Agrocybe pediades TaxID=84607 RepID=A0A8H4QR38_9AGAR|nr:hypothetical protein D9613_003058 [Agrocybe pediades]KAF9564643.1 hypothetical protein CPC08DRAFT_705174 [Agrocybe pediades]